MGISLPLGCVRLTEMFVTDRAAALGKPESDAITAHVRQVLANSGFPLPVPPGSAVVGTGGDADNDPRRDRGCPAWRAAGGREPPGRRFLLRQILGIVGTLDLAEPKEDEGPPPGAVA